ncbi:hypothetical protein [Metabacillus niabensis]|uniref:Transglutaminase-like domain-containing protein n=1 Tax=Metabacillus niabensis TaxID=324854 RepID=A0ABT9Z1S6_9BACI|nr:hypothetical protein [Metabacillus niabensis]MDQ0226201.1 hypothetical protein [Metabacillus niabensis]
MLPTQSILATWEKFNDFPMETLTKVWIYNEGSYKKQRDVSLMREHRQQYGITGNCFDLAIWLLDEFKKDGVDAYPIGHSLKKEAAHVAVVAISENGHRFLCDLGDQWLNPILIDSHSEDFVNEQLSGFFPAAKVQVKNYEHNTEILYYRPNGKISRQIYNTQPIEMDEFLQAAEYSQSLIYPKPLVECRIPYKNEIAHWEFYNWESFLSTSKGLFIEPKLESLEEMVEKIYQKTKYDKKMLLNVLEKYKNFQSKA